MYIPEIEYHLIVLLNNGTDYRHMGNACTINGSCGHTKNKAKCMWVANKCLWWWSMCLTLLSMQCTTDDDIQPSRTSTKPRYCCST